MPTLELFSSHAFQPLRRFGFEHPFWSLNADTIIHTWIVIGIISLLIIACRIALRYPHSIGHYAITSYVTSWRDLYQQTVGVFSFGPFSFVISLFTYIFLCNLSALIPWFEEPTSDLNTTLALGLSAFAYTQGCSIAAHGLAGYIRHYFEPIALLMPLNVVGELASIVSISFRLFGNIFGGMVISKLLLGAISGSLIAELIALVTGINLVMALFFGLFESLIQAFVFAMLTLTSLSLALYSDDQKG